MVVASRGHALATTFEFGADFFETELLPRFLGLKFDNTENEASFVVEREEALNLARVSVLVDHSRFDSSQTTLRWDQVPIQIPGGIQHAEDHDSRLGEANSSNHRVSKCEEDLLSQESRDIRRFGFLGRS